LDSLISKSTDTSASKTAKNEIANNFTLLDLDKNKVSLSDFKDKVVVLNFWATWCPPCRAEIPDFIEVYSTYKGKDVQFLGISGDNVNALTKFVQENKINYPTLIDGSIDTIMPKWGIEAIPTTFILNGNGEVLFSNVGMMSKDQLINAIEKSLNSLK
jgi:peroxiredoxin